MRESIAFADGASAAAGIFFNDPETDRDLEAALRGQITFDEAVQRVAERVESRHRSRS